MKIILLLLIIVLIFSFLSVSFAQELPEPVPPTIDYVFQISWGSKNNLTWVDSIPSALTVTAGVVAGVHNYYGRIGINRFQSVAMDSTELVPTIVIVSFDIQVIPNGRWFDIFRIRSKAIVNHPDGTRIESVWSEPSYWVLIIDLHKLGLPFGVK